MGKALVVYFSRADENYNTGVTPDGNTEILAKGLAEAISADTFAITPVKKYPEDYSECVEVATAEKENSARPEYEGEIADWEAYDTIYLGYPIWWGDLPMIVYTFLENHDFTGKTVAPFNTHEGSGNADTYAVLQEKLQGAKVVGDGFNLTGVRARSPEGIKEIVNWAQGLAG